MAEDFGRYRLHQLIGEGGMGEVWKATDTKTNRVVALKRLRRDLAEDTGFRRRFVEESRLAAALTEAHIIPIHDYGDIDGRLYIDMRWIEGHDLATELRVRGPLSPRRAVHIVNQVASALDAAHAAQLVHRDVKPSNILLSDTGHAYLIDFGISRSVADPTRRITSENKLVGTEDYIAPERFEGVNDSPLVDVYSLACVLHETLTGERAFPGGNRRREGKHLPPPRPSTIRPGIPESLNGIVAQGLAVERQSRYSSAGELARAARRALLAAQKPQSSHDAGPSPRQEQASPPLPKTKVEPVSSPHPDAGHGRRWRPLVVGTMAVGAAIAGWTYVSGNDTEASPPIQVGDSPTAITTAVRPDDSTAYVANGGSGTVSVVNLTRPSDLVTIPVGESPQAITLDNAGNRAYVANGGSDSVSVIDLTTRNVVATIAVGNEPTSVVLTTDDALAYVSNRGSADISVIDTVAGTVLKTIDVSSLPGNSLSGIAVNPDGTRVLVTLTSYFFDDVVEVVDTVKNEIAASIRVGEQPRGITMSSDGLRAYVANSESASVSVLDVANNAVTTNVPVGNGPLRIELDPIGGFAHVVNSRDGTLSTIDTGSNLAGRPTPTIGNPTDLTISPDGRRAFVVSPDSNEVSVVELP